MTIKENPTEVVLDEKGRVTLPPGVLEWLHVTFPQDEGGGVKLLCTIHDQSLVLTPSEAAQSAPEEQDWLEQQHEAFLRSPLGQYILAEVEKAEYVPSIEEVRRALSKDQSSWASDVIADREDRV